MADTTDFGRLYVTRVPYLDRSSPLMEKGWTTETDYPWRQGQCLAARVPFTKFGFAIGLWGPECDEEENLVKAAGVRFLGPTINLATEPEY